MATGRKLTWDKHRKRWKKIYRGHQLYLGSGGGKSDAESYRLALEEFERRRAEIDQEAENKKPHRKDYETAIRLREQMAEWCVLNGGHDREHDAVVEEIRTLRRLFAKASPPPLNKPDSPWVDPLVDKSASEHIDWYDRLDCLKAYHKWNRTADPDKAMAAHIDNYVNARRLEAQAGQISAKRFACLLAHLNYFKQFLGSVAIDNFGAKHLAAYHQHLLDKIRSGDYSPAYAKSRLTDVKTFVRWLTSNDITDNPPRNLGTLKIELEYTEPKTLTIPEVKALLAGATGRTKLYLLLMLNCAFTQKDIGDLKPSEIDWQQGRIVRKRSKTKKRQTAPVVNYKLWAETFRLLQEFGKRAGERVLLNAAGNPVRTLAFKDDSDKLQTNDSIRKALGTLTERLHVEKPAPKVFRKTSSNLLYNHLQYRLFHQLFLGHAVTSVAETHYVANNATILDGAIDWLADQYGIGQ